jgi:hypothetical protein
MRVKIIVSAILSTLFVMPVAYMAADTTPPYTYYPEKSYIVPLETQSGRQILVHWALMVNRVCQGAITRFVVDQDTGVRVSYDPAPAASTIELNDRGLDRTFYLPPNVTPGKKWYYAEGEYACNLLQRFYPLRVRTPRLEFTVLGTPERMRAIRRCPMCSTEGYATTPR